MKSKRYFFMKTQILFMTLLFAILSISNCGLIEDEIDDAIDDAVDGEKITFRLDGDKMEVLSTGASYIDFSSAGGSGGNIYITGGNSTAMGAVGDGITLTIVLDEEPPATKTYVQTTGSGETIVIGYIQTTTAAQGAIYTSVSGEITLTKFDIDGGKISGTFSAVLEKSAVVPPEEDGNYPDEVRVTNGEFTNLSLSAS
jgi:hypothetical protein